MYLGKALNLHELHDTEIKHRMSKAWAKFAMYKEELTNKTYSLKSRLRLFQSVVTPSALYCCGSWTMTADRERLLRTTQRKMLRNILGGKRQVRNSDTSTDGEEKDTSEEGSMNIDAEDHLDDQLEDYTEWIKRTTREAEASYQKFVGEDWVVEQRRRKWQWAGHVARRCDGRWNRILLDWAPTGSRARGRPHRRWNEEIVKYFNSQMGDDAPEDFWKFQALDREIWHDLENVFLEFCTR
jgi:hypothetical protein